MTLENLLPINHLPRGRRKFFIPPGRECYTFAFMKFNEDYKDG